MSNLLAPHKKKWLSNIVLLSFLVLVGLTAFLSNAFKTPIKSKNEFIEQALVFNNKELDSVTTLSLKNKSGEYTFERDDNPTGTQWHMSAPREIVTSSAFIEKLFASLQLIKTKKLLIDDTVNNSNFSLDKPTAILTLTDEAGKTIVISVGIMNTIDNSTYMKISGRSGIYHVEAPSVSLENITITDLIKSSVFDYDIKKILSFKIFKGNSSTPQFEVIKKDGIWTNAEGKALILARVEDLLNDFTALKSSMLIDEQSDSQKKEVNRLIGNAHFTIKIEQVDGGTLTYKVSDLIKSFPDVNLSDEQHFVVIENKEAIIYLVKKEFLPLFELKNESLKSMEQN